MVKTERFFEKIALTTHYYAKELSCKSMFETKAVLQS